MVLVEKFFYKPQYIVVKGLTRVYNSAILLKLSEVCYMYKVVKRDGKTTAFDISKISQAIRKAFDSQSKQYNDDIVDLIALRVTADFADKVNNGLVAVEDIQDSVERVLIQAGYADVAKAYILYRKQREKIRNMKSTILD